MAYHGKYSSPSGVLRDKKLGHHEKVEMLTSWRDDKEAYLRASDEGMRGDDRSDFLRQIEISLSSLQESPLHS